MRFYLILLVFCQFLASSAAISPIGFGVKMKEPIPAGSPLVFPSIHGENLEGKSFKIPEDLASEKNILLVPFKRKQQEDVNTWILGMTDFLLEHPEFSLYELPTIKQMNFFIRLNINNGMRYGIDSKEQREHTITFYLDKESFKSRLEIPNEDNIHIYLVDKEANILWQSVGLADEVKLSELKGLLAK